MYPHILCVFVMLYVFYIYIDNVVWMLSPLFQYSRIFRSTVALTEHYACIGVRLQPSCYKTLWRTCNLLLFLLAVICLSYGRCSLCLPLKFYYLFSLSTAFGCTFFYLGLIAWHVKHTGLYWLFRYYAWRILNLQLSRSWEISQAAELELTWAQ